MWKRIREFIYPNPPESFSDALGPALMARGGGEALVCNGTKKFEFLDLTDFGGVAF